jgi:hypothetical protein
MPTSQPSAQGDHAVPPLRVVQWTSGIVGASAIRAILEDPRLELVGVYAHSPNKVGRDAGEIACVPPIGVKATNDAGTLLALKPDCVVYMPQWPDIVEIERILAAGINVVTTARIVTGRHYPKDAGTRIARAAEEGRASFFGTGMNPMYVPTLALAATAMCRRVHHLRIVESVDCVLYGAAETWIAYGFGSPLEPERLKKDLRQAEPGYPEALDAMAAGLGLQLDDYNLETNYAVAKEDRDLGFMKIAAGTVSALDARWIGLVDAKPVVEMRTTWKLGGMLGFNDDPDFPMLFGYEIDVVGEPNVSLKLHLMPEDVQNMDIGIPTAMPAINAIPRVCAARPGIVTPADLMLVTARGVPR